MRLRVVVFLTVAWTFSVLASNDKCPADDHRVSLHSTTCGWVAETKNFRVQWRASENEVRDLALTCERLGAQSKASWLKGMPSSAWVPQCEIVVHGNSTDYIACLGPRSAQTSGCTTIRLDQGRVVLRRIDLCADALDWKTDSLPHELTHVVLADRFSTRRISPWADEGIAMLAETAAKRNRRLAALREVVGSGARPSTVRALMDVTAFPEPALRTAFYGQSVALVSLLLEWGTPAAASRFRGWKPASCTEDRRRDCSRCLPAIAQWPNC